VIEPEEADRAAAANGVDLFGGQGRIGALAAIALSGLPHEVLLRPFADMPPGQLTPYRECREGYAKTCKNTGLPFDKRRAFHPFRPMIGMEAFWGNLSQARNRLSQE